jgi:hypothetical protein
VTDDTKGLAVIPPSGLATPADASPIFAKVVELASNPGTNPEMFDRLVAWQEREQARQAETAFNAAMNVAQLEIQPVARTTENKQTNSFYAKLEEVDRAIRPIYLRHGFSLSYNTVAPLTPGHVRIECRCAHVGGHSERFYREAPADTLGPKGTPTKTALHGGGSTETFLKRYLACGIFNVVFKNQDDDGVRGGMVPIGPDQVEVLRALCHEAGQEETTVLARLFLDADLFEDVQQGQPFLQIKSALEAKIAQNRKKAAAP